MRIRRFSEKPWYVGHCESCRHDQELRIGILARKEHLPKPRPCLFAFYV